jgi:flavin-dependent trigonelline monooxygenase, reductase component
MTDKKALRDAFGQFATGIAIIGIENSAGNPVGLTINSFASVSLEPPLLSWCLANESQLYDEISKAGRFSVNVLSDKQVDLSNRMSMPGDHIFAEDEWHKSLHGGVFINNALAHFDCRVFKSFEAGDHLMIIGEVLEVKTSERADPPVLYFRGGYAELTGA